MSKFQRIYVICVLLIVASQKIFGLENDNRGSRVKRDISAKDAKSVKNILEKLPGYFQDAIELWQIFEQVHDMFATTPRFQKIDTEVRLIALNSKVDKLIADVQIFKNRVLKVMADKYDTRSVETKLNKIADEMEIINKVYYVRFLEYTNLTLHQEEYTLDWAKKVAQNSELETSLVLIKRNLLASVLDISSTHNNILYLLADPKLVNELMCARQKSAQQSIYTLYEQVMLTEIRAYLMLLFSIQLVNEVTHQQRSVEPIKGEFSDRMKEIYEHVKIAMSGASREVWECDQHFIEGQTHGILTPIFQKHVLHEGDTREEPKTEYEKIFETETHKLGCDKDCPGITGLKMTRCSSLFCEESKSKICTGVLRDCAFKDSTMTVCPSENSSYRNYEYIKAGSDNFWGAKSDCQKEEVSGRSHLLPSFYSCDYCLCTCDSSTTHDDDGVFIDLRHVGSDIEENKVVTGIKIVNGKMVHLEIIEGQLLPGGRINSSTVELVPYQKFYSLNKGFNNPANYTQITWERRTICLDDLESPEKDKVLTGVKFGLDGSDRIELSIRLTRFNFLTGELVPKDTKWISHRDLPKAPKRSTLSIENLDIPRGNDINLPRSKSGQCIEFQTSGLDQDAGQTVVPFLDIQPLITNPPVPMSGAGLFLRGNDDIAGFLTPKLFTFDLEPHMHKL